MFPLHPQAKTSNKTEINFKLSPISIQRRISPVTDSDTPRRSTKLTLNRILIRLKFSLLNLRKLNRSQQGVLNSIAARIKTKVDRDTVNHFELVKSQDSLYTSSL